MELTIKVDDATFNKLLGLIDHYKTYASKNKENHPKMMTQQHSAIENLASDILTDGIDIWESFHYKEECL